MKKKWVFKSVTVTSRAQEITTSDKTSVFFFRILFPKFYKEIIWLNEEYRKAQDTTREKQNELQSAERKIRRLERGK